MTTTGRETVLRTANSVFGLLVAVWFWKWFIPDLFAEWAWMAVVLGGLAFAVLFTGLERRNFYVALVAIAVLGVPLLSGFAVFFAMAGPVVALVLWASAYVTAIEIPALVRSEAHRWGSVALQVLLGVAILGLWLWSMGFLPDHRLYQFGYDDRCLERPGMSQKKYVDVRTGREYTYNNFIYPTPMDPDSVEFYGCRS